MFFQYEISMSMVIYDEYYTLNAWKTRYFSLYTIISDCTQFKLNTSYNTLTYTYLEK